MSAEALYHYAPAAELSVLGFTAKETVTADDYESIIIPAVEELFFVRRRFGFFIASV